MTIAEAPPVAGDIGTSGYAWVMATAPGGEWALVCQARKDTDKDGKLGVSYGHHGELFGDDPEPYLIRGAGPGTSLGEVAGVDPARRYVVVVRDTVMELLDLTTDKRVALRNADTRYEEGLFGGARVAFDDAGTYLLYARPAAKRKIVVRVLATGGERELTVGRGDLRHVEVSGGSIIAHVRYTPPGDLVMGRVMGRSGPPHTIGGRRCRIDYPPTPDVNERHYAPLAGGAVKPRADVVTTVGTDLIVRGKDEALSIERAGTLLPLVPAACKGRVVARSHAHGSVLVACESSGDPATLHLWHDGAVRALDIAIANPPARQGYLSQLARGEYELGDGSRHAQIATSDGSLLVDLVTGKSRQLGEHYVIASHGTKVLLHEREQAFALHDLASGTWYPLPGTPPDLMIDAQRGRLFAAGPRIPGEARGVLVDLEAWTVLGTFPAAALAVSTTGWVLQPAPLPPMTAGAVAHHNGPLRWVRPMALE